MVLAYPLVARLKAELHRGYSDARAGSRIDPKDMVLARGRVTDLASVVLELLVLCCCSAAAHPPNSSRIRAASALQASLNVQSGNREFAAFEIVSSEKEKFRCEVVTDRCAVVAAAVVLVGC